MIVVPNIFTPHFDPIRNLDFSFSQDDPRSSDIRLYLSPTEQNIFDDKMKNYSLDLETPNRWINHDNRKFAFEQEKLCEKIFCLCPFFAKKRNETLGTQKYKEVFFPFSKNKIPINKEKNFDLIYISNSNPPWIHELRKLKDFKICILGATNPLSTHSSPTYESKIDLISRSKVCIVHNEYYLRPSHNNILDNEKEFEELKKYIEVRNFKTTQHKSRVMDAAFCRSMMLCKKDEFNIIENIFKEKNNFLYFDDFNIIDTILETINNYSKYKEMVDTTFDFALNNYTTEQFYNKFILQ